MDAKKQVEEAVTNIKHLLTDLEVIVNKYEGLDNPHHGHAGNLNYLEKLLDEAYEFIRG